MKVSRCQNLKSDFFLHLNIAPDYSQVELVANERQWVSRYSILCGIPSNAADVAISARE